MKKLIAFAFAGIAALSIVACGSTPKQEAPQETKITVETGTSSEEAKLPEAIPCASRAGTFTADDSSELKITDDGIVSVNLYRLCQMDGVVYEFNGDNLLIQTIDPNGGSMKLEFDPITHTLTVKESSWDLLHAGDSFEFPEFKANHEPV